MSLQAVDYLQSRRRDYAIETVVIVEYEFAAALVDGCNHSMALFIFIFIHHNGRELSKRGKKENTIATKIPYTLLHKNTQHVYVLGLETLKVICTTLTLALKQTVLQR